MQKLSSMMRSQLIQQPRSSALDKYFAPNLDIARENQKLNAKS
ncbi:MAG TPA: hypothetical protein V6D15_10445 [Oculatellaceae cyanobacterium]